MNKSLPAISLFLTYTLLLTTYNCTAQPWDDVGGGTNGGVHGLAVWNNSMVASGSFAGPCGRVAAWDTVNWNCFAGGVGLVGRDAIDYHGDLIVCGDFWNVQQPCVDCNGIARWDGTQWVAMGTGFNNDVLTMMIWQDTLYAAGDFTTADGNTCWRLAKWNGTGWLPVGNNPTAFDNEVRAIAVYNNEIWAGGDFVSADGCSTCNRIARYNGTNWVSTGIPNGVDSTVRALYVDSAQNKIYMGGHFIEVAGDTNAKGIAVYDGVTWSPLSQGVYGKGQYVRAVTKYNGDIIIGGYFSHVDFHINAKRVARWNTTTHTWSNVGAGFTGGYIRTFEVWNGYLYAGGSFDTSGVLPRPYIARWKDAACSAAINVVSGISCNGNCNATAAVAASGTSPFTYLWTPTGQTGQTATGLCAGTYTCEVTDSTGCMVSDFVNITEPGVLTLDAFVNNNVSCNGGSDGVAYVFPQGGTAPFTYSWSPASCTGYICSNLAAGIYFITVTDTNGCSANNSVTITEPQPLSVGINANPNILCEPDTICVSANVSGGTPNYTYSWMPAGGNGVIMCTDVAGTYTLLATDANGCTGTATVTIVQPVPVTASSDVTDASCSSCSDGSVSITPGGGSGPYFFSWTPSVSSTATASNLFPGVYTCCVTDMNGCTACSVDTVSYPTSLGSISEKSSFSISPVPFTNQLTIHSTEKQGSLITLSDLSGKILLHQRSFSGETTLNTESLAAGLYFLKLEDRRGVWNYKTVKSQ